MRVNIKYNRNESERKFLLDGMGSQFDTPPLVPLKYHQESKCKCKNYCGNYFAAIPNWKLETGKLMSSR